MRIDAVLRFELDEQMYGVTAGIVREVIRAVLPTDLPGAPSIVMGALNVRGEIVPLIDVRGRFGLPSRRLRASDHFLLCRITPERTIGFPADRAVDLVRIDPDSVSGADTIMAGGPSIEGLARLDDGLLVIANLRAFLSADEDLVLDGAIASRAS